MTVGNVEQATTPDELRQKLRRLGLAGASMATVAENLDGEFDAGISFSDTQQQTHIVGFRTSVIPIETAHQIMGELTVLVRQRTAAAGNLLVTVYINR